MGAGSSCCTSSAVTPQTNDYQQLNDTNAKQSLTPTKHIQGTTPLSAPPSDTDFRPCTLPGEIGPSGHESLDKAKAVVDAAETAASTVDIIRETIPTVIAPIIDVFVAAVPFGSTAMAVLEIMMTICELIDDCSEKSEWLESFGRFLKAEEVVLHKAMEAFERPDYLRRVMIVMNQAHREVEKISKRGAFLSFFYATADRKTVQELEQSIQRVFLESIPLMVVIAKEQGNANSNTIEDLKAQLNKIKQCSAQAQENLDESVELERILNPSHSTVSYMSIALRQYMRGTRFTFRQRFEQWLHTGTLSTSTGDMESRLFWIKGSPGSGKTIIAAMLCEQFSSQVLAVHFCRHDHTQSRSPATMIRTIAFQLATRLPSFHKLLCEKLVRKKFDLSVRERDVRDLWMELLVAPLGSLGGDAPKELKGKFCVIFIDALDESEHGGLNALSTILSRDGSLLPQWIRFAVTSRPELPILQAFAKFHPVQLDCKDAANLEDIKLFLNTEIVPHVHKEDISKSIEILTMKSEGLFLYVSKLVEDLQAGRKILTLEEIRNLPQGMDEFFTDSMKRILDLIEEEGESSSTQYVSLPQSHPKEFNYNLLHELLQMILCAFEPLSYRSLCEFVGCSLEDARRLLKHFSAFLFLHGESAAPESKVEIFHRSLKDWMTDERRKLGTAHEVFFFVDLAAMHFDMAERCLRKLVQTPLEYMTVGKAHVMLAQLNICILPQLRVDQGFEAYTTAEKATVSVAEILPQMLHYAIRFGPSHSIAAFHGAMVRASTSETLASLPWPSHLSSVLTFLAHPQYLHLRSMIGDCFALSTEYAQCMKLLAQARAKGPFTSASSSVGQGVALSLEWCWFKTEDPSQLYPAIAQLQRFVLGNLNHMSIEAGEFIYQYALSFPDQTIVSQLAAVCLPWFLQWKYRHHGFVVWKNKPQQLSALVSTIRTNAPVSCVSFSPDMLHIASCTGKDTIISVYHTDGGPCIQHLIPDGADAEPVICLAFDGSSKLLACGNAAGYVSIWRWEENVLETIFLAHPKSRINAVGFSFGSSNAVFSGGTDGKVTLYDLASKQQRHPKAQPGSVLTVAVANGSIAFGGECDSVSIWNTSDDSLLQYVVPSHVHSVAFNQDGTHLAVGCDAHLLVFNSQTGHVLQSITGHNAAVRIVAFSSNGDFILSASNDGLAVWNWKTNMLSQTLNGHSKRVTSLSPGRDGRVISGGEDETIRVWNAVVHTTPVAIDLPTFNRAVSLARPVVEVNGHLKEVRAVVHSSDGAQLASCGDDGTIRVWDHHQGALLFKVELPPDLTGGRTIHSVAFRPAAKQVIGAYAHGVCIWDSDSHQLIQSISSSTKGPSCCVSVHPLRDLLLTTSDTKLLLWSGIDLSTPHEFEGRHEQPVIGVAFSPTGDRIVSCGEDKTIRVWDSNTRHQVHCLAVPSASIRSIGASSEVIAASYDRVIALWSMGGDSIGHLEGHLHPVSCISLSRDGTTLVSGSEDNTVRLWNTLNHKPTMILGGHSRAVTSVSSSLDGRQVVSCSEDRAVRIWNLNITDASSLSDRIAPSISSRNGCTVCWFNIGFFATGVHVLACIP